jgi:hypothetical protein
MHHLLTTGFAFQRAFDRLDLAADAAHTGEEFALVVDGVGHGEEYTVGGYAI